jgi:hypothetical protein
MVDPAVTNVFTSKIDNYHVPKELQMPLSVKRYDGSSALDDHINFLKCLLHQTCFRRIQEKAKSVLNHVAKKSEMPEFWYFTTFKARTK